MSDKLPDLFEPTITQTDFIDGLVGVEVDRHGLARLVWFREQRCVETGRLERHVQARMVLHYAAMIEAAGLMLAAAKTPAPEPDVDHASRRRELN